MALHPTQERLLELLREHGGNLEQFGSLRNIGAHLGIKDNPQVINYHLDQLQKKGLVRQLKTNQYLYEVADQPLPSTVDVPLYRSTAQCGPEGFFGNDDIVERVPVPTKIFGIARPSHFFLIKAKGKSMEPVIEDGDLVLAHKQPDVESNEIAIVVHDEMPMIKRVKKILLKNEHHIILESLNRDFEDILISEDSDFRICGVVKGVMRVSN